MMPKTNISSGISTRANSTAAAPSSRRRRTSTRLPNSTDRPDIDIPFIPPDADVIARARMSGMNRSEMTHSGGARCDVRFPSLRLSKIGRHGLRSDESFRCRRRHRWQQGARRRRLRERTMCGPGSAWRPRTEARLPTSSRTPSWTPSENLRQNMTSARSASAQQVSWTPQGETVLFSPHLSWRNEPLKEALEKRLGVPVLVDNDANTTAWAELRFGAGTRLPAGPVRDPGHRHRRCAHHQR